MKNLRNATLQVVFSGVLAALAPQAAADPCAKDSILRELAKVEDNPTGELAFCDSVGEKQVAENPVTVIACDDWFMRELARIDSHPHGNLADCSGSINVAKAHLSAADKAQQ